MAKGRGVAAADVSIDNVLCCNEKGKFRANEEMIGWKGANESVIHETSHMKRAEWFEGKLRVEFNDGVASSILPLDGFHEGNFSELQRYFTFFKIELKKNNTTTGEQTGSSVNSIMADRFDADMKDLERCADLVDGAKTSVKKNARETNLLKKAESVRDFLDEALKGDRGDLECVFAANGCERIGRLRLVILTVKMETYVADPRWVQLRDVAAAIEAVLQDKGSFLPWRPAESDMNSSIGKRQMMVERNKQDNKDSDASRFSEDLQHTQAQQYAKPIVGIDQPKVDIDDTQPEMESIDKNSRSGFTLQQDQLQSQNDPVSPAIDQNGQMPGGGESEENDVNEVLGQHVTPSTASTSLGISLPGNEHECMPTCEVPMRNTTSNTIVEGWVWKRSKYLRRWRRRWLVLTKLGLETMKTRYNFKPTMSIEKDSFAGVFCAAREMPMERCFYVVDASGTHFYIVSDSEAEKAEWIKHIDAVLARGS